MNERIEKLAQQYKDEIRDGFEGYDVVHWHNVEDLIQDVVRECISISTKVDKNPYIPDGDQAKKIIQEIKQHFGVEE